MRQASGPGMRTHTFAHQHRSTHDMYAQYYYRGAQVEMLMTVLDCFRLASASALRTARELVHRVLALAGGATPRSVRTLLAASAHVFARPEFLRAVYPRNGLATGSASGSEEVARQDCQMLQVWA